MSIAVDEFDQSRNQRPNKLLPVSVGLLYRRSPDSELPQVWMWPHQKAPFVGRFEFPGGKIESAETPLQALVRELAEEIDLKLDPAAVQLFKIHPYRYPDKEVLLYVFLVELPANSHPWHESSGQWFHLEEARDLAETSILPANKSFLAEVAMYWEGKL